MSDALSLIKKAETAHTDKLGATHTVDYQHLGGTTEIGLRCFVSGKEYDDRDKKVIRNLTVFSSLLLSSQPKMRDVVTLDGVGYSVVRFELNNGRYIIYTEDEVTHTGKRYPK